MNFVKRVLFAGRIGQRHQSVAQLLEGRLRNVGVVVPNDAAPGRLFDCGTELRMVVTPQHLVMTGGAVEKQTALFVQIKKAAACKEIVTRAGLGAAIGFGQRRFINGVEARHVRDDLPHTRQ